jgi:hypothetical protein
METKKFVLTLALATVFTASGIQITIAQEGKDAPEAMEAMEAKDGPAGGHGKMTEEMMAKMKEFSTPNDNHQVLEQLVGSWTTSNKFWMEPGAEPQITTGEAETQWIHGGRFIEQEFNGSFMGQPYQGRLFSGYDNLKKEYVNVWIDNMNTGITTSTSTYDPATKTFNEKGKFSCPIEGGDTSYRGVLRIVDENTHVLEHYMTGEDGKEMKGMEITYTRKK